jgi:hypothetical protein
LLEVTEDLISKYYYRSLFNCFDADKSVRLNFMTFLNACMIIRPSAENTIVTALPYPAKLYRAITPEVIFSYCEYAIFPAVFDRTEQYHGISTEYLDPRDAFSYLASLYLAAVALMYTDPDATQVEYLVSEYDLLRPGPREVNASDRAILDLAVLHQELTPFDPVDQVLRLAH